MPDAHLTSALDPREIDATDTLFQSGFKVRVKRTSYPDGSPAWFVFDPDLDGVAMDAPTLAAALSLLELARVNAVMSIGRQLSQAHASLSAAQAENAALRKQLTENP